MSHAIETRVAVVILNWNGRHHLERFLPSVVKFSEGSSIIVADNASTDDSLAFLAKNYPKIGLIKLKENHGFAGGYNLALDDVFSEYAVLLNSDVELTEGWLRPLLDLMDQHPDAAACQPKIRSLQEPNSFEYAGAAGGFIDYYGYPFCRGRIFDHLEPDNGQYDKTIKVFWASGACFMVRLEVYKKLGGLDAGFFAHMEEIDLCWRMLNRGYSIWSVSESHVFHLGGGTLHKSNPRKTFLNIRNGLAMLLKNSRPELLFLRILIRLVLDGVAGAKFLLEGNWKDTLAIIKAHFAFYGRISEYLAFRKQERLEGITWPKAQIYQKSIVFSYFLKGRKKFSDLEW